MKRNALPNPFSNSTMTNIYTAGDFAFVNRTSIANNVNPPATYGPYTGSTQHVRQTEIRQTIRQDNASSWRFQLGNEFVFSTVLCPPHVTFAVEATEGFPVVVMRPIEADGSVVIESKEPFSGAVHIIARQAD